jgi:ribosomal protein L14E/L6E/L27E
VPESRFQIKKQLPAKIYQIKEVVRVKIQELIDKQNKANDVYDKLCKVSSMEVLSDIINSLDEETAKNVLKSFVYAKGNVNCDR